MLMLRKIIAALLCASVLPGVSARAADPAETAYIRDALVKQGLEKGLDKSPQLEKLVTEFRNEQLARLALEAARDEGMPDFTARAEEIYQARLDQAYRLPLRLRVRVLELRITEGKEAETVDKLKAIRAEVVAGKTDFKAAVLAHSQAPELSLTEGDSQWFRSGQKPDAFFEAAEQLSADKPLSEVFVHQKTAYLLNFLERKEAETRTFADVKAEIIEELQQEYRADQEETVLDALRGQFKQSRNGAM
jgi:peptidyl-prolyl cis-trans isomerase C